MIVVAIPCFEGARSIGRVVAAVRATGLQVLVVDDGSTDGSGDLAEAAGATVLRHASNLGKGAALQTAFGWARAQGIEAVVSMDADGQHDPAEIEGLLRAHREHPDALVIGVRSFAPEDMPRRSRIGNRISTWWISRFAGRVFRDTQSGFRVYPRNLIDRAQLRSRRFETETELLLQASRLGVDVVEVPIRTIYGDDHASHFRNFDDTLRVIRLVLGSPFWALVTAALALGAISSGCAHAAPGLNDEVRATLSQGWKTMRAEHRVALEVTLPDGKIDRRRLRGAIVVARPDRLRLRALGPAGIRLFDLLVAGGRVEVLEALEAPGAASLMKVVEVLGRDLAAAYDLAPRSEARLAHLDAARNVVIVTEPGRSIRLESWARIGAASAPRRMIIDEESPRYHVEVEVPELELDVAVPEETFLR